MDESLKNIVNLGIGAVKTIEEEFQKTFKNTREKIDELIDKGQKNNGSAAQKIHQFIDNALVGIKEYEGRIKEITESLLKTLNEFDPSGDKKVEELNKKIDELQEKLKQ